jgi:hypothetical protein
MFVRINGRNCCGLSLQHLMNNAVFNTFWGYKNMLSMSGDLACMLTYPYEMQHNPSSRTEKDSSKSATLRIALK